MPHLCFLRQLRTPTTMLISLSEKSLLHSIRSAQLGFVASVNHVVVDCHCHRRRSHQKRHRRFLERRWKRSRREVHRRVFRECCRETNQLIHESRSRSLSSMLTQSGNNARHRCTVVRQLLHSVDSCTSPVHSVDTCNTFAKYSVSKMDTFKANIRIQLSLHFYTNRLTLYTVSLV